MDQGFQTMLGSGNTKMEELCDLATPEFKSPFADGGLPVKRGAVCIVVEEGKIMLGLVKKVSLSP